MEAGGGVRSDIAKGPVTYTQIYETFPWADDTIYQVNMTGQEISDYVKGHTCDAAVVPRACRLPPTTACPPSSPSRARLWIWRTVYTVAINNYMYLHDYGAVLGSESEILRRTSPGRHSWITWASFRKESLSAGPPRYTLNTEFSGGYRAVVTMMNDADNKPVFEDGFIRF